MYQQTGISVMLSYLCSDKDELHQNAQRYTGGVAGCEYGMKIMKIVRDV